MSTDPETNPEATLAGTVIAGKYRVDHVLGAGGMGVVVKATHIHLNQAVALKLLRADAAKSPEMITRFLREAKAAAKLPPEHIARVTDIGQTDQGEPFLVMELLAGHDLKTELEARGPLPIEEAVGYILQASEGIAEAHAAGLVHRDLKPANLFLDTRSVSGPVIKVLDFGLSKSYDPKLDKLTHTHSSFGTPGYMSPEQIRSAKYAEPRSDQHALGMILFELLTGRMPFLAENVAELIVVIFTTPPPHAREFRPDVPKALDAALVRAMGKRPEDRYLDLAAFAAAIAPFGGAESASIADRIARILDPSRVSSFAPRPSSPEAAPQPRKSPIPDADTHVPTMSDPSLSSASFRKKPPVAALAAAGALVIFFAILFLTLGNSPEPSPASAVSAVKAGETAGAQLASAPPEVVPNPEVAPAEALLGSPETSAAPASPPEIPSPAPPKTSQPASSKPSTGGASAAPRAPISKAGKPKTTKPSKETARDVFGGDR